MRSLGYSNHHGLPLLLAGMKSISPLKVLFAGLIFCNCLNAYAQRRADQSFSLIVDCTCNDTVGKGYARALRDAIAQSPRYAEVSETKETRKDALKVSIISVSIGDDSEGSSSSTALSVVFTIDGVYLDHLVQTCGDSVTKSCAAKTMNNLDDDVAALREAMAQK